MVLMGETTVPSITGRDRSRQSVTGVYLHCSSLYFLTARENTLTLSKFADLRARSPFICIIGDVFHSE